MPKIKTKKIRKKKIVLPIFDFATGKKIKNISWPEGLDIEVSPLLIHQVLMAQESRKVKPAHTKTKGEVRGGGAKPWRQKGTGRARHGSIRSPIWRGGGITFGPRKESISFKKINKKMRHKALIFALKNKASSSHLILVNNFRLDNLKTKEANNNLKKLPVKNKNLLVFANEEKDMMRAFKNLKDYKTILVASLNLYDLLANNFVIFSEQSFDQIKK